MAAIETDALNKRFGEVHAVRDLDLTVESGEVFGFLGPNGAGKSTTINILLGFLAPSSGSVRVLDRDVTEQSRAVRQRLGLLPEGYEPYPNLTGREHVQSAVRSKGVDDDPDRLLDRVGLDPDDARRPAKEYSTGMVQRMTLAVSLVGDPDLLIFDEPSSGLDPDGVALLREIIREETDRGATVFFSSHILEEVEKVCDRVGILNEGELVALDTIDSLRDQVAAGATVSATLDTVPDEVEVASLDGVRDVAVDGDTVTAECTTGPAKMDVLRRLDERATVEDIHVDEASLEALFDQYTKGNGDGDATTGADRAVESAAATGGGESA